VQTKLTDLAELTGSPSSSSCESDLVSLGPLFSDTMIMRASLKWDNFS
jgi:hypothetical protein